MQGYLAPWWRGAYSDESWEDLTATELRKGIQLRMLMGHRELRPSLVDPSTGNFLDGVEWTGPLTNLDLGGKRWLRQKFDPTGWCLGLIKRILRTRKGQPPAVSVLFVGDAGERTMTLLVGHHSLNLDAPWGAWHLLQREAVEVDAQVTLLE